MSPSATVPSIQWVTCPFMRSPTHFLQHMCDLARHPHSPLSRSEQAIFQGNFLSDCFLRALSETAICSLVQAEFSLANCLVTLPEAYSCGNVASGQSQSCLSDQQGRKLVRMVSSCFVQFSMHKQFQHTLDMTSQPARGVSSKPPL